MEPLYLNKQDVTVYQDMDDARDWSRRLFKEKFGYDFDIGDFTFIHWDSNIVFQNNGAELHVGKYCSINKTNFMLGGNHNSRRVSQYLFDKEPFWECQSDGRGGLTAGNIVIGNDIWIGYDVTIMGGVRIGNGAIIGAKSVVTENVPDYAVVMGNPAKIIRMRYSQHTINKLLDIAWWNWDENVIKERAKDIISENVDEFINKYHNTYSEGFWM